MGLAPTEDARVSAALTIQVGGRFMLRNYLLIALRGLSRQKANTLIVLAGLSVGFACSFLILLWVSEELAVDRFHREGDRIYRVMRNYHTSDRVHTWSSLPKPVADFLDAQIPGITHTVLVTLAQLGVFTREDGVSFRRSGYYVSDDFLEVFTFPLLYGDEKKALDSPEAILISKRLADQYFGKIRNGQDVIGKSLLVDHRKEFVVSGIFENTSRSSLKFDYLIPFEDFLIRNSWLNSWGNSSVRLYVKLNETANPEDYNNAIRDVINDNHTTTESFLFLQPFEEAYLHSQFENGIVAGGRIDYVRIFTIVAIFIIVIATINYMNLATARASLRAKEIGIRKVVGARRGTLIGQFMGESILLTGLAAVIALVLVQLLIPIFDGLTGKQLALDFNSLRIIGAFAGICLLTGIIGGIYPAIYLASFNPIGVLRGTCNHRSSGGRIRQGLVVFQFGCSIFLMIATFTVYGQLRFMKNKNLGFERENLLRTTLEGGIVDKFAAVKLRLLAYPQFLSVSRSNQNPLSVGQSTSDPTWDGKPPEAIFDVKIINAGFDFVETLKLRLLKGRAFSPDRDRINGNEPSYIVNQRMVDIMQTDEPVGKHIAFWGDTGTIVGVVEDFHISSMHNSIDPLILRLDPPSAGYLYTRIAAGKEREAIEVLRRVHSEFNPGYPLGYKFVNEDFLWLYRNEETICELAAYFSALAGFISCLGLFGLASFAALQRSKEFAVRKVLGATGANLLGILSRDFIILVGIAFVLAVPVAYFALNGWLNQFAYRVGLGWIPFAVAGGLAMLIAWFAVISQAVRVVFANPTDSIRSE